MAAEVAPDDLAARRNDQGLLGFFSLDSQHPVAERSITRTTAENQR